MMCLLCHENLRQAIAFGQLFTLGAATNQVCENCLAGFAAISEHHCPTCYKDETDDVCQDCQFWANQEIAVQHQALFRYNERMKEFFSTYKFEGDYELRKVFSDIVKKQLKKYRGYTLVPVPLGPDRLEKRGFNQVEGLLEASGMSYKNLLSKRDIKASSSKNRQERLETEFAFQIREGEELPLKILLVDDIYTTGTTLNRLKKYLQDQGCPDVCTFSLAR